MHYRAVRLAAGITLSAGLIGIPQAAVGQTVSYAYDVHGRLIGVDRTDGTTAAYSYDAASNRTVVVKSAPAAAPNVFDLGPAVENASGGAFHVSAAAILSGFGSPWPVTVSGGQYRVDGGPWLVTPGAINAGQSVQVVVQASGSGGVTETAILTVGGVSDTFQVTTAADTTPDPFELGGPVSSGPGVWSLSNTFTVSGTNALSSITITGGEYKIDGGAWRTGAGTIASGQTVQVQVLSPWSGGASQTSTLTIGGVTDSFQVTTVADTTPDPFNLGGPTTGLPAHSWALSNAVAITGINAAAEASISGGQYRVDGGAWQTAPRFVTNGQAIQVQAQAPAARGGVQTATLTVGGVSGAFQAVTLANRPPVAVNDGTTVYGLGALQIAVLLNDSDPDGDALTITSVTTPTAGTAWVSANQQAVHYSPWGAGFITFQYTITDGHGGTATATVSLNVIEMPPEDPCGGGLCPRSGT